MSDVIVDAIAAKSPIGSVIAKPHGRIGYRPDIDGLRAVAVLSVVIYHINKAWMPGGFVGVDIFFVISGFLITRNIWGEMRTGQFSLANFYMRRIRRIAPAFLVMAMITVMAGAFLLLPDDLLRLGRSALWGAFSLSNVYFWRFLDTSYFADSSEEEPLLHTWSLGVEEQFYFVWPAILLLAMLFPKKKYIAIGVAALACIASFAFAELILDSAAKFSYFMLPTRAGELMFGALLALWSGGAGKDGGKFTLRPWLPEAVALAGFGLIVFSLSWLNHASPFPGINAVYPCLGAVLVMLAGAWNSRLVALVLTQRPVVFIGLISYSLYLWHWPILAFIRYFFGTVSILHGVMASAAMLALAILSYRYVELPARHWKAKPRLQLALLYLMPTMALSVAAFFVIATGGFQKYIESNLKYKAALSRLNTDTAPASDYKYNCQLSSFDPNILARKECVLGPPDSEDLESEVLLWGDSQAAHYIGVVGTVLKQSGGSFRNATHSACPPVFGPKGYGIPAYRAGCDAFRPHMQAAILSGRFSTIVMSGAWDIYDKNPNFRRDFEKTVSMMLDKNLRVILIGQAPYFANYNRNCELRGARVGGVDCKSRFSVSNAGPSQMDRYLESLDLRFDAVSYVDIRNVICHEKECSPYVDGKLAYYNPTHLSMSGSWRIGERLMSIPAASEWMNAFAGKEKSRDSALVQSQATAIPTKKGMAPMLDGYVPAFPYHVRSQKNIDSMQGPSGIVIEFWGVTRDEVAVSMKNDLTAGGFELIRREPSGDALRMDFQKQGYPLLSVNVGPLGSLKPQTKYANGIAYFRW